MKRKTEEPKDNRSRLEKEKVKRKYIRTLSDAIGSREDTQPLTLLLLYIAYFCQCTHL
jgi:hypothetical protein